MMIYIYISHDDISMVSMKLGFFKIHEIPRFLRNRRIPRIPQIPRIPTIPMKFQCDYGSLFLDILMTQQATSWKCAHCECTTKFKQQSAN